MATPAMLSPRAGAGINRVDAEEFYVAIKSAKIEGKRGAYLSLYSEGEYQHNVCYLTDDKKAGFALDNGNVISVFKHPQYNGKATDVLIPEALRQGGNRLDCFNGILPIIYSKFGFKPVAKIHFNREFAPHEWNYERDKEPDIIFMIYQEVTAQVTYGGQTADERKVWVEHIINHLPYSSTYGEGQQMQQDALRRTT